MKHSAFIFVVLFAFGCSALRLEKSGGLSSGTGEWRIVGTRHIRPMEEDSENKPDLPPMALESEDGNADDPKAWNRRGTRLFNKGRYEEALTAYNLAISLKADDPEVWNNKGATLAELGFYEEALAAYNEALTFRPDFPKAWNNKGLALAKLERYEESLKAYEALISLRPDDAEGWKNKTAALANLGRIFEALDAIKEALSIQPDFEEALALKEKLEEKIIKKKFTI